MRCHTQTTQPIGLPECLLVNAVKNTRLWAVEFLIPLTVLFRELNSEFEMRAVKTRVRIYLPAAAPEDLLQVRYVFRKKCNTSAARRVHQRAFNYRRRPASYTFHNVNPSDSF